MKNKSSINALKHKIKKFRMVFWIFRMNELINLGEGPIFDDLLGFYFANDGERGIFFSKSGGKLFSVAFLFLVFSFIFIFFFLFIFSPIFFFPLPFLTFPLIHFPYLFVKLYFLIIFRSFSQLS